MAEATADDLRAEVHAAELREAEARMRYEHCVRYTERMRVSLMLAERKKRTPRKSKSGLGASPWTRKDR